MPPAGCACFVVFRARVATYIFSRESRLAGAIKEEAVEAFVDGFVFLLDWVHSYGLVFVLSPTPPSHTYQTLKGVLLLSMQASSVALGTEDAQARELNG